MALATATRDLEFRSMGREIYYSKRKLIRQDWSNIVRLFGEFCKREDEEFVGIPDNVSYASQRDFRRRFSQNWS